MKTEKNINEIVLEILNQVESNGELLDTDKSIEAMKKFKKPKKQLTNTEL